MTRLTSTEEQSAILDAAATDETVAISAGAGTGKTSTLRMIGASRTGTRMLYVAFNKAIQVEAERSFGSNVTCKTAHSLAYRAFGAPIRERLNGPRQRGADVARILGIKVDFGFDAQRIVKTSTQASLTMGMVARFCRSADPEITTRHVPAVEGLGRPEHEVLARHLLPYATRAWADLAGGPRGRLKPTHDVYLKQWQLAGPRLTAWDVVLYDEAQDADPCIAAVVEHQDHAQLIAVGDSAQAIYSWRGAGDFLNRLGAAYRLRLTQSWRFGQAVADEANAWLGALGTDMRISGNPARDSQLAPLEHPDTILCRTNAGTIDALLDAHDQGVKVHLVGDGTEMLALAQAAERLQAGRAAGHPELALFSTWDQVVDYAVHDPSGSDLAVAVRMIDKYGADGVIAAISGSVPASRADRVVSTAHKAKGLEWPEVRIGGDFREPLDPKTGEPLPIPPADAMLAYVSVTRAMDTLDTGGLGWVHDHLAALEASSGQTVDVEATPISAVVLPASEDTIVASGRDGDAGRPRASTPGHLGDAALREQAADRIADPRDETLAAAGEHEDCFYSEQAAGAIAALADGPEAPPRLRIEVGSRVLVADERGEWLVRSVAKDGSLTCYQAGANGRARSFRPEWCTPASRTGKGGKPVKVRSATPAARRARAAWREQAGFPLPLTAVAAGPSREGVTGG